MSGSYTSSPPRASMACSGTAKLWVGLRTVLIIFQAVLILSFLYAIKSTLIQEGIKSGNSSRIIVNTFHYNGMSNSTFKYKAIVVGSPLLCKIRLVTLVLVPSFLKIDANQIVSMILDFYRR
jgi:hypothetical protein